MEQGSTLRAIAVELGVSIWVARTELRRAGLQTRRMATAQANRAARDAGLAVSQRVCSAHGRGDHVPDTRGTYRCTRCRAEAVAARRRRVKEQLVKEAGGRCRVCGYDRCLRALGFHHLDPKTKSFGLAYKGMTRSLQRAREEIAKCVLLCSNCHMEVEAGLVAVALNSD